jgi:hypothetical protein
MNIRRHFLIFLISIGKMIGDYVAFAYSPASLFNTHVEAQLMPGGHAGMTEEEYKIPLIVVEKINNIL